MGWIIFMGIVFLALGLLLFFRPDLYWALTSTASAPREPGSSWPSLGRRRWSWPLW